MSNTGLNKQQCINPFNTYGSQVSIIKAASNRYGTADTCKNQSAAEVDRRIAKYREAAQEVIIKADALSQRINHLTEARDAFLDAWKGYDEAITALEDSRRQERVVCLRETFSRMGKKDAKLASEVAILNRWAAIERWRERYPEDFAGVEPSTLTSLVEDNVEQYVIINN